MTDRYEQYEDEYDNYPTKGKMSANKERVVNYNMATLKRVENARNRYVREGLLK